jgi:very-short-patch-repair endonuclease
MNMPEAEAVVECVQHLRMGDSRLLSLGIVTPFVAQKEMIWERLDSLELSSDILVDTAYGFQGDERDIIIFSPVVGRGMPVSATLWVEIPPNLINVAITRAREAFFFIGDLDFCLQLKGILRKLALYCREIQLLRKTSPAELELFSWMVVKGWEPKIHPRISDIEVDFMLQARNGIRLAIEVDGQLHHEDTKEQDKARDAFLYAHGYDVLRRTAREVLETPFEVIHQIEQRLSAQ